MGKRMRNFSGRFQAVLAVLLFGVVVLSAGCGGGGGGGGSTTTPTATTFSISGSVSGEVNQGVTITLSGISSAKTTTDASGKFSFSGLANGVYTVTPSISGYTFNPPNEQVNIAGSNISTVDFTSAASATGSLTVTTFAGAYLQAGSSDGTGSAARFNLPYGMAADSNGNIYVADTDNNIIRKITPEGVVTTLAGGGSNSNADGTGSVARFKEPCGVAVDSSGTVYVADTGNCTIRKITPSGVVTTLAGKDGESFFVDATGTEARFVCPWGIAVDSSGNVYVSDANTIRKITPDSVVTTLAGTAGGYGSFDGTGSAAQFSTLEGLAVDGNGNIYAADSLNDTVRKITPDGVVTTLAGTAGSSGSSDGTGSAARFNLPMGVAVDGNGNVYVADCINFTIRKITPEGVVTTLAGQTGNLGHADGTGSTALFHAPAAITVDSSGNVYVSDGYSIRKITQ